MANRFFLPLLLTLLCTISESQSPPLHIRPPTTTTATPPEAWNPPPLNGETPSTQPSPSSTPPSFRRPPPPPPPTKPNEPSPPSPPPPPPLPRTGKTSPNTVVIVVAAMLSVGAVAVVAMVVVRLQTPAAENLGQMVDMPYMEIELPEITSPEIDIILNWAISSGNVELATHAGGVGVMNQATLSEIEELEPEAATSTDGVGERDVGGTVPASVIMVA